MHNKKLIIIFSIICVFTLIVILGSVVFRVSDVNVFCYNAIDVELEQKVKDASGLDGSSVFIFNEAKAINKIESAHTNVKVINIERQFPNKVIINYVKKIPYGYIDLGDGYIIIDNDLKILEFTVTEPLSLIKITVDKTANNSVLTRNAGEKLEITVEAKEQVLLSVLEAFARLNYRDFDAVNLLKAIDISFDYEQFYIYTRSGVVIIIEESARMLEKLQMAVSVYLNKEEYRMAGILRALEVASGEIQVHYSAPVA